MMTICELKSNLILKMEILISFIHPLVPPNLNGFFSSMEYFDVTLLPLTFLFVTFSNHAKVRIRWVLFMPTPVLLSLKKTRFNYEMQS